MIIRNGDRDLTLPTPCDIVVPKIYTRRTSSRSKMNDCDTTMDNSWTTFTIHQGQKDTLLRDICVSQIEITDNFALQRVARKKNKY